MKPQAILLDVGGVLVDETELYQLMHQQLLELLQQEGFAVTHQELTALLNRAWRCGSSTYRHAALWHFAKPDVDRFQRLHQGLWPLSKFLEHWSPRLMGEAKEVVAALAQEYRLALAANQPVEVKDFLRSQSLLPYFDYDLVSEELGLSKPNPLFFQVLLDRLGVNAGDVVMVGDRIDNDILPAKQLGMSAVRVLSWPFALQEPRVPLEAPDLTIQELSQLPEAMEKLSRW